MDVKKAEIWLNCKDDLTRNAGSTSS